MEILYASVRVKEFEQSLEKKLKGRVWRAFTELRIKGNDLALPFSRALGDGLFELRITGKTQIRYFYTFKGGAIVILHGFIKKDEQVPQKEIEYARKILNLFAS